MLAQLDHGYRDELPVVDAAGRLLGSVHMGDVLDRYRSELAKQELENER